MGKIVSNCFHVDANSSRIDLLIFRFERLIFMMSASIIFLPFVGVPEHEADYKLRNSKSCRVDESESI